MVNRELKFFKITNIIQAIESDSVYFVEEGQGEFSLIVTDLDGNLTTLVSSGGGSGVVNILSSDFSILVSGNAIKDLKLSQALQNTIASALQANDPISALLNDAGYLTLADLPTFTPGNYDLTDFTNTSGDPFVKVSQVSAGATNLGYTPSAIDGTITSDTGSDATIPLADNTNAGLISPAEKDKITTAVQPSDLGAVATSNDYNDLNNTPTIPSIAGLATTAYVDSQDTLKVDKVSGKSLIDDTEITRLATVTNFDNSGNVTALADKVDKIAGKGLSTEDYTTAEKAKVTAIDQAVSSAEKTTWNGKQDVLVSGTSIKTVNSISLLGSGNINASAAFEKYGDIYNKNSWTDLLDFTNSGSGVSVVSNKLSFTGGTTQNTVAGVNSQLPSFLRLNKYTGLDRWSMTVKVKVNQVPSSTSYGFSVGVIGDTSLGNSFESSALGFFNMTSNGTLTGKGSLILGTQNNLIASSNTVITFSQNDYIELIVERELSNIKVSARNITTNSGITTATFNYNTNFADGTTNPFLPNSGTFVIGQHGGSFIVDDIKVKSSAVKRANLMLITDSKGIYNAPVDLAFPQLLERKYEGVVWNGGPIDITQGVINKLPEILALNPKQIVLAIGRNDVMTGISTGTWQANLVTIDNALTAAGIAVYWTNGIKETSTTQTSLRDYINTTFAGRVINTHDATNYASCLSADAIHPSITGHQQTADAIIASGFIVDYSNYNSSKQPSQSVTDLRYTGQIIANGGTAQKPTSSSAGDIIIPDGGALIGVYNGTPSWYGKYIPFVGGIAKFINSFTPTSKYSFQWLGSNGTNGTETTSMVLSDRGNLIVKPNIATNMLLRTDLPTSGMYLTEVGGGLASSFVPTNQSTVGQSAQILPFTTNYATEIRNKSRIGKIDKYVSNGTDDNQMLAETTNAKGRTSFFGTGVTVPNITTANRDLIGSIIGGYMTALGSGVTTATVAFSGGGGTGATATAIIASGQIQGITITNGGSGYTSAPTVTFTGDGTASSATCVLSMDLLEKGIVIYNTTLDVFQGWNGTMWMTF